MLNLISHFTCVCFKALKWNPSIFLDVVSLANSSPCRGMYIRSKSSFCILPAKSSWLTLNSLFNLASLKRVKAQQCSTKPERKSFNRGLAGGGFTLRTHFHYENAFGVSFYSWQLLRILSKNKFLIFFFFFPPRNAKNRTTEIYCIFQTVKI